MRHRIGHRSRNYPDLAAYNAANPAATVEAKMFPTSSWTGSYPRGPVLTGLDLSVVWVPRVDGSGEGNLISQELDRLEGPVTLVAERLTANEFGYIARRWSGRARTGKGLSGLAFLARWGDVALGPAYFGLSIGDVFKARLGSYWVEFYVVVGLTKFGVRVVDCPVDVTRYPDADGTWGGGMYKTPDPSRMGDLTELGGRLKLVYPHCSDPALPQLRVKHIGWAEPWDGTPWHQHGFRD